MFIRFNLLTNEQLASIGFSEKEIVIIRQARPLNSIIDLLFLEGIDAARAIPMLVGQEVLVGHADCVLLPPEQWRPLKHIHSCDATEHGEYVTDDDEDAPGAISLDTLASGDGWTLTSSAKDTIGVIADCSTTKTFQVRATRRSRQGEAGNRNYERFRIPTEREAADGAKQRLTLGIAAIIAGCECTNTNCLNQVLRIMRNPIVFAYSRRYRGQPEPRPRVRGWEARAIATATVTITCQ